MSTSASKKNSRKNSSTRPLSPVSRRRPFGVGDTTLSIYLRSVSNKKPLDVEEEQAAAKQLSELEQRMWQVVLGNPKTSVKLLKVLRNALVDKNTTNAKTLLPNVDDILAKGPRHRSFEQAIETLAIELCEMDEDRDLIADVTRHSRNLAKGAKNNSNESAAYLSHINEVARSITGAKHRFIQENLGLVVNIAKRYHVEQMPLADLIQEGNIGLMRAVDKFDYRKGFRFSTYASWWIRSYISRAIVRKSSTVRIPEYMLRDRNRMKRTEEASRAKLGRSLSEDELAAELGVSKKRLTRTKKHDVAFVESLPHTATGKVSKLNLRRAFDEYRFPDA